MMAEYTDQFTLDGTLKPANQYVSKVAVEAAGSLLDAAFKGDKIAAGKLQEVMTTSDLPIQIAHLISAITIPQFDEAERTWTQVAGTRVVPDFGPVRLMSIYGNATGAGVHEDGGLMTVPEGTVYPYISVSGEEAFYAKLSKLGAAFGFTWESSINDVVGFYEQIPGVLLDLALDAEEREVYDALINGTTTSLASQTLPDGTTTAANAAISPEAIWAAIIQLQNVTVNGRKVGRASGYNVVVPAGTADYINWKLNQNIISIQDGSVTFGPGDRSVFNNVSVVETTFLSGTNWVVLPKPGAIRRPVLELLRLRGHERPELRARGNQGHFMGSSSVAPFTAGSWENDTIDYRIRYVAGGVLWSSAYSVKSNGTGT